MCVYIYIYIKKHKKTEKNPENLYTPNILVNNF